MSKPTTETDILTLLSNPRFDSRLLESIPGEIKTKFQRIFVQCDNDALESVLFGYKNTIPSIESQLTTIQNRLSNGQSNVNNGSKQLQQQQQQLQARKQQASKDLSFHELLTLLGNLIGQRLHKEIKERFAIFYKNGNNLRVHISGNLFKKKESTPIYSQDLSVFPGDDLYPFKRRTKYSFLAEGTSKELPRRIFWYFRNYTGKLDRLKYCYLFKQQKDRLLKSIRMDIQKLSECPHSEHQSQYVFCAKIDSLLRKISRKFQFCNFHNLLQKCCPLKLNKKRKKFDDCSMEDLLSLKTSKKQLFTFIHMILNYIIEKARGIFGSMKNMRTFERNIKTILTAETSQRFFFWDLAAGIDMKAMRMNFEEMYKSANFRINEKHSNHDGVLEIAMLKWIYTQICYVLQAKFYITESSGSKFPVYYRYDLWEAIVKKEFEIQTSGSNWKVSPSLPASYFGSEKLSTDLLRDTVQISKLRFIPKSSNLRSIAPTKYSTNQWSQLFKLIRLLLIRVTKWESRLFEQASFSKRLLEYKKRYPKGPFYVVKGDFQNCYPSIDQLQLYKLLKESLSSFAEEYGSTIDGTLRICIVRFYRQTKTAIKFKEELFVENLNDKENLADESPEAMLKSVKRQFGSQVLDRKSIMKFHEWHILQLNKIMNILKVYVSQCKLEYGRNHFKMLTGIRQGALFAPQLCEFYLEHLFRKYFSAFPAREDTLLIRYVDDFVFVSTDFESAKEFAGLCKKGFSDFRMKINEKKFDVNFGFEFGEDNSGDKDGDKDSGKIRKIVKGRKFEFLGLTFHCDDASLSISLKGFVLRPSPFASIWDAYECFKQQNRVLCMDIFERSLSPNGNVLHTAYEYFLLNGLRIALYLSQHYKWRSMNQNQNPKQTESKTKNVCPIDLISMVDKLVSELEVYLSRARITKHQHLKANNLRIIAISAFHLLWKKCFHHRKCELKLLSDFNQSMSNSPLFNRLPKVLPNKFVDFVAAYNMEK